MIYVIKITGFNFVMFYRNLSLEKNLKLYLPALATSSKEERR